VDVAAKVENLRA
jgi:hypothetical protein